MIQLIATSIDEKTTPADLERIRRNQYDAIRELQLSSLARALVLRDVVLEDGVVTPVAHRLARPVVVLHSPPRGAASAGLIEEIRDGSHNRGLYVVLKASGFGASITIDVVVL